MTDELRARWERTEAHLRAAITSVDLPGTDRVQVEEFLDHNELGVAFEWIVSVLREARAVLPTDTLSHLSAAAAEIGLEDNSDWQAVQTIG